MKKAREPNVLVCEKERERERERKKQKKRKIELKKHNKKLSSKSLFKFCNHFKPNFLFVLRKTNSSKKHLTYFVQLD